MSKTPIGFNTEKQCPNCVATFLVKTLTGQLKCPECGYSEEYDD